MKKVMLLFVFLFCINFVFALSPNVSIDYPLEYAAHTSIDSINYTVVDDISASSCWYTIDDGITNSSAVVAGTNFTSVSLNPGRYNLTVYCNDSLSNIGNDNLGFVVGNFNDS